MKVYVAHSKDFDYREKLYEPLRNSPLNTEHEIILPHEGNAAKYSRDFIKGCDLFVAEISRPSTSLGVEIGWADGFGIPVITIREKGAKKPWWADELARANIEYEDPADLVKKLEAAFPH